MQFLGHKNIKNTLIYVQLDEALYQQQDAEFTCKGADTVDEAEALIETSFEYVCELNKVQLFRKRK